MTEAPEITAPKRFPFAIAAWIAAALAVIVAIYGAANAGLLSWEMAVESRLAADEFVGRNAILAYAAYLALFIVLALMLFPAQLWIIVFGAMVFGFWPALIASWLAAVGSAALVFALARGALAGRYREKAAKYLAQIEKGFQRDQFTWMLAARFIPVVPYCISNVAPAFLGARFAPFVAATVIGVIPYIAAYTFVGAKAASMLDASKPPDVASLAADMAPVMLAIAALPVAALLVRRWGGSLAMRRWGGLSERNPPDRARSAMGPSGLPPNAPLSLEIKR